ncbi:transmembrane protein 217-like [Macrotis lagotis]|uniref:transmembrane protein 217-like n=1 Tax=Macrotis lagotis TaxID=92651 RepID=UPI003D686075
MGNQHWLGINIPLSTFLSGVFTIVVTNMFFVFENKYLGDPNCTRQNQDKTFLIQYHIICWSFKITLFLSIITILISCLLLYSIFAKIYQGMVLYVIWIIFYEAVNTLLQTLTNNPENKSPKEVKFLRWFGLISRISIHGFCICFVTKYAHIMYKKQMQSVITSYNLSLSLPMWTQSERDHSTHICQSSYPPQIHRK